ncbi:MAG: 50S ribosomal protein L15 [bacterium]|jgi:large subunit ribosomal protein L15|nr:50S ribosomal protein L15 [bacterium]
MNLGSLNHAEGAHHRTKRIGRGDGSGHGGTSCRGHKGQRSRSGAKRRAWFEGGQMPIQRRLPKRGFTNIRREENQIVQLTSLATLAGGLVNPESLLAAGLIGRLDAPVKILCDGELAAALTVSGIKVSKSALARIEAAGGSVVAHQG